MLSQARVLGGGSSINGMVYTRGQPWDYDHWADLGAAGWSYADVLPLFRKSEASARGADTWHGADGPLGIARGRATLELCQPFLEACAEAGIANVDDLNAGDCDGVGYYDTFVRAGLRSSTASAFLRPARARPNLGIITGAQATRLLIEGGRARGCEFLRDGRLKQAHAAAEVVLCGGALRSPQLLMLSGIGPADALRALGIAVLTNAPQVGANLQNHVSYKLTWSCSRPVTAYRYMNPWRAIGSGLEYFALRRGYLSHAPTPLGGCFRSDPALEVPDVQFFMNPALVGPLDQGLRKLLPRRHGFSVFVNQGRPRSRGEVRLASADPLAAPRVHGRYLSDPRDREVLARSAEIARGIARQEALAPYVEAELSPGPAVRSRADLEAHIRANAGNHWHVCGTCRMGSDGEAVLDPRLRVLGVAGLRVADASVMPAMPNGNTAAPVIMIAEKAAEMIAADAS
jgi:choline dehydrogenase